MFNIFILGVVVGILVGGTMGVLVWDNILNKIYNKKEQ